MATLSNTPSSAHYRERAIAAPESAATPAEQMDAASESAILRAAIISIAAGAVFLGTISLWLWYGLHHYQNCL